MANQLEELCEVWATPSRRPAPPREVGETVPAHRASIWRQILAEQRRRGHVAYQLHEDLAQVLVACKMKLGLMSRHAASEEEAVLADAQHLLDHSLEQARGLVTQLSPAMLYGGKPAPAMYWLAHHMRRHGLKVTVHENSPLLELAPDRATVLFQAVGELLLNVVHHAGVERATIRLDQHENLLAVTVADEGRGFDVEAWRESCGKDFGGGLVQVMESVLAAGGQCTIDAGSGQGTRVMMHIPTVVSCSLDNVPHSANSSSPEPEYARSNSVPRPIRVMLADDHRTVRQSLRSLLAPQQEFEVVAEAVDGMEAVQLAHRFEPDVVLMDVNMPGMTGIEATRELRQQVPNTRVIGLSVHDDPEIAASMRDAGAVEYLNKATSAQQLFEAVRRAGTDTTDPSSDTATDHN